MTTDVFDIGEPVPDYGLGDLNVLAHALLVVENDVPKPVPWALEFGTGTATSTRLIADKVPVLTFDSFNGLPEDWRPDYGRGSFAQEKIPTVENATVVVGMFEDTLPAFDWPDAVSLIHLDADLYTSTATVLEHAGHLIVPGVIVVMDEAFGYDDDLSGETPGELRAWLEFAGRVGLAWDVLGHGREQVALRITARMLP